jgi:transcriptional regulator of acetoin/glycerol metabolism
VLAAARERFLTAGALDSDEVRSTIAASWWRSRGWQVAADHVRLPYVKDPNLETPLARSAAPVLDRLLEELGDQAVSVILTDPSGMVLDRRTADGRLEHRLDQVQLAPGFSYAEQFVGTNGIGTALEGGQATCVFGHEHYAEDLEDLGCAGVPVHHPVSGRMLGVLDLTCWSREASPLMLALAKTTARQIEQELTTLTGLREFALFQEYLRACRRSSGIVFALNNDVVMMNDHARQLLSAADQAALLSTAAMAMIGSRRATIDTELSGGGRARMYCSPVHSESGPAGGVVRVRLTDPDPDHAAAAALSASSTSASGSGGRPTYPGSGFRPRLPGLAGSSAIWQRACEQVGAHYRSNEWITVGGEPGTGKLALLRAVHRHQDPAGRLRVLDAAESDDEAFLAQLDQELAEERTGGPAGAGALVLLHVDRLRPPTDQAATVRLLAHHGTGSRPGPRPGSSRWLAATHGPLTAGQDPPALLSVFPAAVEIPPLRHRAEDLQELIPHLLTRSAGSTGTGLTCSPTAVRLLMRNTWPGNVAQLRQVLATVARRRRTGVIEPGDLPPECQSAARRVLSPLESLERDAVVHALLDAGGNKNQAARALGLSRATIYRKIHDYGIDLT